MMKKIEEIIEMMKDVNPDIKMDDDFKQSLKNKLEVTSYAKLKNTKNKKNNIVKNKFFNFRKVENNIFEKPKISFLKIISSIFIWVFAVFWFLNFYGQDFFILEKWWEFKYNINTEKHEEKGFNYWINDEIYIEEEKLKNEKSDEKLQKKLSPLLKTKINITDFKNFCKNKKGTIKNNTCEYWNKKCSKKDFLEKKCD